MPKNKSSEDRLDRVERILERTAADAEARKRERDAEAAKRKAESDADFLKIRRTLDEIAARQKEADKRFGGFTQTAGEILEEEIVAALQESRRIGDIVLDEVLPDIRFRSQFDAAGINGKIVVVVEIKHKFSHRDVKRFAEDALPRFAEEFPNIAGGRKIFGAIGVGGITSAAKKEAAARGLFVLRLRNRKLVVENDKARAI